MYIQNRRDWIQKALIIMENNELSTKALITMYTGKRLSKKSVD